MFGKYCHFNPIIPEQISDDSQNLVFTRRYFFQSDKILFDYTAATDCFKKFRIYKLAFTVHEKTESLISFSIFTFNQFVKTTFNMSSNEKNFLPNLK